MKLVIMAMLVILLASCVPNVPKEYPALDNLNISNDDPTFVYDKRIPEILINTTPVVNDTPILLCSGCEYDDYCFSNGEYNGETNQVCNGTAWVEYIKPQKVTEQLKTLCSNAVFDDGEEDIDCGGVCAPYRSCVTVGCKRAAVAEDELLMTERQRVTLGSYTVKLLRVGPGSVVVDVNNQSLAIDEQEERKFSGSNGFTVNVVFVHYITGNSKNAAILNLQRPYCIPVPVINETVTVNNTNTTTNNTNQDDF